MKKRMGLLIAVVLGMLLFVSIGFPFLRSLKTDINTEENKNVTNQTQAAPDNIEKVDITTKSMCKTSEGTIDIRCQTEQGCDNLCSLRGCQEFGMKYNGSVFEDKTCECICLKNGN